MARRIARSRGSELGNLPQALAQTETETSSFSLLPVEIIERIFQAVVSYDALSSGLIQLRTMQEQVEILLAPLHVDGRTRKIFWGDPKLWILLARMIRVEPLSYSGYRSLLQLCATQSGDRLDTLNIRRMSPIGDGCWTHISLCLGILTKSRQSLKRCSADYNPSEETCRRYGCFNGRLPPNTCRATNDFWSQSNGSLSVDGWEITKIYRTDRRLFEMLRERGSTSVLRHLGGAKLEAMVLDLPTPSHSRLLLANTSTLRHLHLRTERYFQLDMDAFVQSSFDVLETLFIACGVETYLKHINHKGAQCQMPSLQSIHAPARFLHLLSAPSIATAGVVMQDLESITAMVTYIKHWSRLKTLALYWEPLWASVLASCYTRVSVTFDPMLKTLLAEDGPQGRICPMLEHLAFYFGHERWWDQPIDLEDLSKQWDWRRCSSQDDWTPTIDTPTLGLNLAKLEKQRRDSSNLENRIYETSSQGRFHAPLRELRVFGFKLDEDTLKQLLKAPAPFRLARSAFYGA